MIHYHPSSEQTDKMTMKEYPNERKMCTSIFQAKLTICHFFSKGAWPFLLLHLIRNLN
jgi:hypothetical protein